MPRQYWQHLDVVYTDHQLAFHVVCRAPYMYVQTHSVLE